MATSSVRIAGLIALALPLYVATHVGKAAEPTSVTLFYGVPRVLTLGEPLALDVVVDNDSTDQVTVDFGKNSVGNFRISVRKPNGAIILADLVRPTRLEEAYVQGILTLEPKQRHTQRILLNDWFEFRDLGEHLLAVNFVGQVRRKSGTAVDLDRSASLSFRLVARNEQSLRQTCEGLVRTIRTSSNHEEALFAARMLASIRDPLAVAYLRQVIEPNRTIDFLSVEFIAIEALEHFASTEARDVLILATTSVHPDTAAAARAALERLDPRRR